MSDIYTGGIAQMRLNEISTRLSGRMQAVASRTGIDFSMMFAQAVTAAYQPEAVEAVAEPETADIPVAAPAVEAAAPAAKTMPAGKEDYVALIVRIAAEYGLDSALITAVVQAESNFNPYLVSSAGAVGLMQLMPATAAGLGVTDAYDPAQNIDGGVRYLLGQIIRYDGDIQMALAAYNCGPYGLKSRGITDLSDPAQRSLLPEETRMYLDNIAGILETMGRGGLLEENYYA